MSIRTKAWLLVGLLWLICEAAASSYHLVWLHKDVDPPVHIPLHLSRSPSRRPKQLIGASVVTSVSSVKEHDPEIMRRQHENEYRLNNGNKSSAMVMEPKFFFYLYNDEGDLIREKLSIHDIQSLLLQQTQIEGLKNRGWLFEEKESKEGVTPPSTTTNTPLPKKPGVPPTQEDVKGVLDKIHNIIQDAKKHNKNEMLLSSQVDISGISHPKEEDSTPPSSTEKIESKTGDFMIYEDRYHGLHGNEYPWVDYNKKNELAHLEQGLAESLSRTSPIKDDLAYFPVHPQVYRNKVFKDFLSLEYEASPYDEENGSSSIHMVSLGDESDLVPVVYSDDPEDEQDEEVNRESEEHNGDHSFSSSEDGDHSPSDQDAHGDHSPSNQDAHGDHSSSEEHAQGDHSSSEQHAHEDHSSSEQHALEDHSSPEQHAHGNHSPSEGHSHDDHHHHHVPTQKTQDIPSPPAGHLGILSSTEGLDRNMKHFININNDLSLYLYASLRANNSSKSNVIFSPLSAISTLSMIFLGARGMSSWQMNELLHLDEMISFNPHLLYKELMDSIMTSGSAGFVKQLLIDQKEDPFIEFYKSRIQYFYKGHADKIDFANVSTEFKDRINYLFKELNPDKSDMLLNTHEITSGPPMAVMGASYFNCELDTDALSSIQPSEVNFINLPTYGRRLVPIRGLSLQGRIQAGYDSHLDATSVQIPLSKPTNLSLILVLPGKPWEFKVGGLSTLESKLNTSDTLNALFKRFVPLEAQVTLPELSQDSLINLNATFSTMGSTEIFGEDANFVGINGGRDLKLSSFYEFAKLSLEAPVKNLNSSSEGNPYIFRFERQFLYILRHDPTGLIVSIGRYVKPKSDHLL